MHFGIEGSKPRPESRSSPWTDWLSNGDGLIDLIDLLIELIGAW